MNKHKLTLLFVMLLAAGAGWTTQTRGLSLSQKPKPLHQVKKIYVVNKGIGLVRTGDAHGRRLMTDDQVRAYIENKEARYQGMAALLEQELIRVGFEVVKDVHDADAELVGILKDGTDDPSVPDQRSHYTYRLLPATDGDPMNMIMAKSKLWETDFRMSAHDTDKKVAIKVAENLLNAWLRSAKKAGLNVGDKVQ